MKRQTLQSIIKFLIKTLTRTQFLGVENIPASGPVIIATNHMSYLDIPLLFANPARPEINALVTTKYQNTFFLGWFCNTAEAIWINRDIADFGAMRAANEVLKQQKALGISPEGTRSHINQLQPGKPGTVLLALKTQAPIVPVGIWGTEGAISRIFTLQRPRLTLRFGPAFTLPPIGRENRAQLLQQYTDEIMCRIAALMPDKYWGYYRENPRVRELMNTLP